MNKEALVSKMVAARAVWQTAVDRVPADKREVMELGNGWSVKDLLAHIGFWEDRAAAIFRTLLAGEEPHFWHGDETIDKLNADVYAQNHPLSWTAVVAAEQQAYDGLLALVQNATEEDLYDPLRFEWLHERPFVGWIKGNTIEHYEEHVGELNDWLSHQIKH